VPGSRFVTVYSRPSPSYTKFQSESSLPPSAPPPPPPAAAADDEEAAAIAEEEEEERAGSDPSGEVLTRSCTMYETFRPMRSAASTQACGPTHVRPTTAAHVATSAIPTSTHIRPTSYQQHSRDRKGKGGRRPPRTLADECDDGRWHGRWYSPIGGLRGRRVCRRRHGTCRNGSSSGAVVMHRRSDRSGCCHCRRGGRGRPGPRRASPARRHRRRRDGAGREGGDSGRVHTRTGRTALMLTPYQTGPTRHASEERAQSEASTGSNEPAHEPPVAYRDRLRPRGSAAALERRRSE
jgi:hypothetical protein